MSVNEKLMVTVDVAGDISKFQSSIKTIQTELGKLQLPNNLKEGFGQIFNSLNREIEKVQGIAGKKKIDLVDQKQLQKSFSAIENYYNRLVNKMQSSKIKTSLFAKDEKVLSQINSLLTVYNDKVNANAATQKKLNKELDAAQKAYNKINEKPQNSDEVKQVTEHTKALKEQLESAKALEKVKAAALAEKQADPNVKVIKATKAYKEHEAAVQAVQQAQQAYNAAKAAEPQLKTEAEAAALKRVEETLLEAQKAVDDFNANQSQIETTAWEKLKTDLQAIEGINWKEIGIDPNSIKNAEDLKEALKKIKEVAGSSTGGVFGTINEETKTASASLTEMGKKAEQTAQSLLELGNRQNDIQQLASRLTHFFSLTNQFMIMRRIIQNAITTIKELDKAMTETAVVTKFDVSDMWAQLPEYTKVANELGATTKGAYETMTLFYQQGLDQQQAFQLGTETMKMARIAGLDYAEATDRMTNALRGFNMELNDVSSQRVNDVYSNLAAKSASNVDELSTAMTKTASIAHAANMEFETTAAFLAQIIETTRESAETAGTALKTVIARFSEVKKLYSEGELVGQDEEGEEIDVNRVSTALRAAGVNLNEYLVGAKGLDEVFIELASKWDNLDLVTQRYIATMAAGSRQQSRFIALMQDYSRQTELVGYAQNAAGASTEQFNKTLDSLEAKLNKLENAWNEFTMGIANSSLIKGAIDLITGLITAINKITSALGPVGGAITKVLLLFAGFKGIRALFDGVVKHIATIYVNVAKQAGAAGTAAGAAYAKGFTISSNTGMLGAFNKLKSIFSAQTWIGTDQGKSFLEASKAAQAYQESLNGVANGAERSVLYQQAMLQLNQLEIESDTIKTGLIKGEISATELAAAATDDEAFARIKNSLAAKAEKGEIKAVTDEEIKDAAAKIAESQAQTGLLTKGKAYLTMLFSTSAAKRQEALQRLINIGAIKGEDAALKQLDTTIKGMALGWVIAIIAGIVALVVALSMAANELSIDGKLEDAANLAKSLDDRLQAVADTLDEFEEHTSSIETLKDELNDLTQGTQEWSNKVQELNNQYIELAKIIGSDFWQNATIENGLISVSDDYLKKAQQEIIDQQTKLQQQQIQASVIQSDLGLQNRTKSLIEGNDIWQTKLDTNFTKQAQQISVEDMARLMGASDMESFNEIVAELFNGFKFNGDDVKAAQNELQAFVNEVNSTSAQIDAQFQLMASNLDDKTINADSYGEIFKSIQGKNLKAIEDIASEVDANLFVAPQTIADNINKKAKELNLNTRELTNMEDAFDEYVRVMNDAYGEGTFKREGWDIKKITDEGNYEKVDIGAGEVAQVILSDWVNNQDFEGAYREKIDEIQKAFEDDNLFQGKEGREVLEKILGGTFSQEDIKGMGKEVFEELQTVLDEQELDIEISPILKEGGETAFISDLENKISKAGLNISADKLFQESGLKGQNAFIKLFTEQVTGNKEEIQNALMGLGDITNIEDFSNILDHISKINIYDKKQWENFPKWLKDAGINIPNSELETFISNMEELLGVFEEFDLTTVEDKLSTLYQSLTKVQSGDLKAESIDQDTYDSLIKSGAVNETDFYRDLTTGNYVYINGQDALEAAIYSAIDAINGNTEEVLNSRLEANKAVESAGDEWLLEDLQSGTVSQQRAIESFVSTMQNAGIGLDSLQIKGLNDNTDIANLTPEQRQMISEGIASVIIGGVENAQAQLDQYNGTIDYTQKAQQMQQPGASYGGLTTDSASELDTQLIEQAASQVDNLSEKMDEAREATKNMGLALNDLDLKALVVDTDKAQKAMQNLGKAFSDTNKDVLEAGRSLDNYQEYDKALSEVAEAGQELFGKGFDASYVANNLELINQLLNGTEQESYEAETAIRMAMNPDLVSGLSGALTDINGDILSVQEYINGIPDEIAVNGYADVSQMVNAFLAAGATAEQALAKAEALSGFQITSDWVISGWVKKEGPVVKNTGWAGGGEQKSYIWVPQYTFKTNGRRGSVGGGGGSKGGSGGGGGGGGGGSNKEPEDNRDWKNPYDKLYNEYAKLEELQRKRNNLEKEFALTVDTAAGSVAKTTQQFKEQLKNLQAQADTQEKIVSGKKSQIANAQNKTYSVEDHVVKSYATAFKDAIDESNKAHGTSFSSNLADYAKYNSSTGQMEIDWNQIQSLEGQIDSAAGEVLEAYVSELEGLEDQLEEAQDALIDIKTEIKAMVDQAMEDRIAYVDAMREAMIAQYQKQIDKLSALNDAINESNSRIFDSLQQQIDLERQIRDNTKTEDEIAQNEARLAYLQRDTSGANDLEIQKLQQTLADQRENYSDTLVDQELARLQDQADEAAEQREHQIELMEAQLQFWQDTGYFEELIDKGISEGKAMEIYKDYTDYANKTRAEQAKIMQDFYSLFNKGGSANTAALAAADAQYNGGKYKVKDSKGNTYDVSYDAGTGTWKGKGANGQAFSLTAEQITSADTNKKILTTGVNLSQTSSSSGASSGSGGGGGGGGAKTEPAAPSFPYGKASDTSGNIKKGAKGNAVKAIQYALNKLGYGNSGTKSVDGVFGSGTANAVKAFQKAMGISADGIVGKNTRAKFKAKGYSTGGLADYTGPAWLHGSPSKPELVLNAKDTENFIQLKNILADVAKDSKSGSSGGDNYFDIKVEVGEIGSDYDVEKMITKIKDEIDQDARYRNVNSINFIR